MSAVRKKKKAQIYQRSKGSYLYFLALLMAPFTMIAGALINVDRVYGAISVFDEALCNASNSTLGTYDSFLKSRFGLLAIRQGNTGKISEKDVQEFINGIFKDYMSVNCQSLPGAYSSGKIETNARGVYPLSDMSVLKNQVLEYSKYRVPANLLADAIDIEELMNNLFSSIPGYDMFDAIISGENEVDNITTTAECIADLRTAVLTQNAGKQNYLTAYTNFENAVQDYNSKKEDLDKAQNDLDEAEEALQNADEEHYADAQASYDSAKAAYDSAKSALDSAESSVNEKKSVYSGTISSLSSYVSDVKNKKQELATAISDTVSGGVDFLKQTDKAATKMVKKSNAEIEEARNKKLEKNKSEREQIEKEMEGYFDMRSNLGGLTEEERENIMVESDEEMDRRRETIRDYLKEDQAIQDELDSLHEVNDRLDNGDTLFANSVSASEGYLGGLSEHYKVFQDAGYMDLETKLDSLSDTVSDFDPKTQAASFTKSDYFASIDILLLDTEIDAFEEFICNEAQGDTGIGLLKAIVEFWDALFNIGLWYNPELTATIDTAHYNSMGGLPSKRSASYNPYADVDSALSEQYKKLMGSFSTNDNAYSGSILDDISTLVTNIQALFKEIKEFPPIWKIAELAKHLKIIYIEATAIIQSFKNICVNFTVNAVVDAFKKKLLPAGYIYYNVPCRTNFNSFESFGGLSKPFGGTAINPDPSLSFSGAEVEYIIFGSESEIGNQTGAFWVLYLFRCLADCVPVATNSEVSLIIETVSAIPYIGWLIGALVLVFFILVEPFIDTVLLCGGAKVPLYKQYVYLTPGGLMKLATAVTNLKIVGEEKENIKQQSANLKSKFKITNASSVTDGGFLELEYKQYMLLNCMLFVSEETMYKRLADIIEMEASCKAAVTGDTYDLTHSFTYLRASGSFEGKMFITMSDSSVFSSKDRVIYQGY